MNSSEQNSARNISQSQSRGVQPSHGVNQPPRSVKRSPQNIKRRGSAVNFRDVLLFGFIASMSVFAITTVVLQTWRSLHNVGVSVLLTLITFVVVSGVAALLHLVTRNDTSQQDAQYPVLS